MKIKGVRAGVPDTLPRLVRVSDLDPFSQPDDALRFSLIAYPVAYHGLDLRHAKMRIVAQNWCNTLQAECALYAAINMGLFSYVFQGNSKVLESGRNAAWVMLARLTYDEAEREAGYESTKVTSDRGDGIPYPFNKRLLPTENYFNSAPAWIEVRQKFLIPIERYGIPSQGNRDFGLDEFLERVKLLRDCMPVELSGLPVGIGLEIMLERKTAPSYLTDPEDGVEILVLARQIGDNYVKAQKEAELARKAQDMRQWAADSISAYLRGEE